MKNALSLMSVLFTESWVKENCPAHNSFSLDAERLYVRHIWHEFFKLITLISFTGLAFVLSYQIATGEDSVSKTAFVVLIVIFFIMVCITIFFKNSNRCNVEKRLLKDWIEKRKIILGVYTFRYFKDDDNKNDPRQDLIEDLRHELRLMRLRHKNMMISPELCDPEGFLLSAKELHNLVVYCGLTTQKFEEFWA